MQEAPVSHQTSNTSRSTIPMPQAYAFDLDGTIYLQTQLLPGSLELLEQLTRQGTPFVFATNNSSVPGDTYVRKLSDLGISVSREQIITSNDVAIRHLLKQGFRRPYLLAPPEVLDEYAGHGLQHDAENPDCVLLAFDLTLTYEKISRAARFISDGLPYLATHPDPVCPTIDGSIPDVGSFIEMFRSATGQLPLVLGKPHEGTAAMIVERLGQPAERIAFVGDRLHTDILMARDHGFIGILTLTGVTDAAALEASDLKPDVVVRDLVELAQQAAGARR
jgi:HAD superfamily hydrolase (TIGR01450 family)